MMEWRVRHSSDFPKALRTYSGSDEDYGLLNWDPFSLGKPFVTIQSGAYISKGENIKLKAPLSFETSGSSGLTRLLCPTKKEH